MARKSKGKFDMKGHTLPGIKQVAGKVDDGRASSSPFQMKPTGDSPANFNPFGGFGGGRPMWKSILDPAGFFGKGNQNQGNAPVQQPGQSFAKANFEQLQQQPNPNADPNITPPPAVGAAAPVAGGPVTPDPVVDPNAGVSGQGTIPVQMKGDPKVKSTDYLHKTPSIVASDAAKEDYDADKSDDDSGGDEDDSSEIARINKYPHTKPPLTSDLKVK